MSFRIMPDQKILEFENESLNVMNVLCNTDVPLGTFFNLQMWLSSEDAKLMADACKLFGEQILISWDVEDDKGPVTADGRGFISLPMSLAMTIITTWTENVGSPKKVSASSLNGISQSVEALTGQET